MEDEVVELVVAVDDAEPRLALVGQVRDRRDAKPSVAGAKSGSSKSRKSVSEGSGIMVAGALPPRASGESGGGSSGKAGSKSKEKEKEKERKKNKCGFRNFELLFKFSK